jgi:uncharacterized protein YjbI with pentapeptide repeats
MLQTNLGEVQAKGADFSSAELTYADFSHADLTEAEFSGAVLFRAVLHSIKDEGASFTDRARALGTDESRAQSENWHG